MSPEDSGYRDIYRAIHRDNITYHRGPQHVAADSEQKGLQGIPS